MVDRLQAAGRDSKQVVYGSMDREEARAEGMARERALLMRYSGLAIQDAVTLTTSALEGDLLTLRRAKSGTRVLCCLPEPVADTLGRIARPDHEHYF